MPTLALLDGHSLAYRAFFALPPDLGTKSGQITNAVYGFTRMLLKLVGDHHPDAVAVAWDVSRDTFRLAEYSEYKANRSSAPDQFRSQLPLIREVMDALGYSQLQLEGYEADDVIASVAGKAIENGWDVLVVTGDRDSFQLVGRPSQGALHPPGHFRHRAGRCRVCGGAVRDPPGPVPRLRLVCVATPPTTSPVSPVWARRPPPGSSPSTATSRASTSIWKTTARGSNPTWRSIASRSSSTSGSCAWSTTSTLASLRRS